MRKRIDKPTMEIQENDKEGKSNKPFSYAANEDIYLKSKNEVDINPEIITEDKVENEVMEENDLDVPGSELDDQQEMIGSEDEENNYYSLGGDNHINLEESKGE